MTTAPTAAKPVSLKEEAEAAREERIARITPSTFAKVQRVHELKRLMAPLEAEIEAIKAKVLVEMDKKEADILTHKGVPVVSRNRTTRKSVDFEGLFRDHSEIAGIYISNKDSYRIDWKKPVDK